jgi:hypothetical protein
MVFCFVQFFLQSNSPQEIASYDEAIMPVIARFMPAIARFRIASSWGCRCGISLSPYKLKQLIDLSCQRNMLFTFDGKRYGPHQLAPPPT